MPYTHEELVKHRKSKVKEKSIFQEQFKYEIDSSDDSEDLETDAVKHEAQWWAWDTM